MPGFRVYEVYSSVASMYIRGGFIFYEPVDTGLGLVTFCYVEVAVVSDVGELADPVWFDYTGLG